MYVICALDADNGIVITHGVGYTGEAPAVRSKLDKAELWDTLVPHNR